MKRRKEEPDRRPWAVVNVAVPDGEQHRCWFIETALELEIIKERAEPGCWMVIDLRTGRPYRKPRARKRA